MKFPGCMPFVTLQADCKLYIKTIRIFVRHQFDPNIRINPIMKSKYILFLPLLLALCMTLSLSGQSNRNQRVKKLEKALERIDFFYDSKQYFNSAKMSRILYNAAVDLDHKKYMAIALNRQGRAILENKKISVVERAKTIEKFARSQQLLEELGLKNSSEYRDNNKHISFIEQKLSAVEKMVSSDKEFFSLLDTIDFSTIEPGSKEAEKIEKAIRNKSLSKANQKMLQKVFEMKRKNVQALKKLKSLNEQLVTRSVVPDSLGIDLKQAAEGELEEEMNYTEQKIVGMNADKAKEELLLANYKNLYDSLLHQVAIDSMALAQKDLELSKHQAELEYQEAQKWLYGVAIGSILLIALGLLISVIRHRKHNDELAYKNNLILREQKRSDQLLLNILPEEIASELKRNGVAQTQQYDSVSVMFSDFENFSGIAEILTPSQLVADLDYCFRAFDKIIEKYNLEKIKTIGDAYMCAGGLPAPSAQHAFDTIKAAIEIQQFLNQWKQEKIKLNEPYFEARIGIHTGPIIAGVVGEKKFAYDIWGDTVNVAARMETGSIPGRINISQDTYQLVKDKFSCTHRGKVAAKNKGEIDMYFVEMSA